VPPAWRRNKCTNHSLARNPKGVVLGYSRAISLAEWDDIPGPGRP